MQNVLLETDNQNEASEDTGSFTVPVDGSIHVKCPEILSTYQITKL
jgi:hypothetical protein